MREKDVKLIKFIRNISYQCKLTDAFVKLKEEIYKWDNELFFVCEAVMKDLSDS